MPSKHTKESIRLELQRIQNSVPACYKDGLLREEDSFGAMKEVLQRALFGNFPEEKKKIWRQMLANPTLNQREVVEDEEKAKKYNQWEDKQIRESIKAGRLPTRAQLKKLNFTYDKNDLASLQRNEGTA